MKIIHICQKSSAIFLDPFKKFLDDNYESGEHEFIYYEEFSVKKLREKLKNADKIILHSLFMPKIVLFFFFFRKYLSRTYWICFGGDIDYKPGEKHTLKEKLYVAIKSNVIKKFKGICTLVKYDYDRIRTIYNMKGKWLPAIYINTEMIDICAKYKIKKNDNVGVIKVLLGNSATESNKHIEAIRMLEKYSKENINIICPLSYGDKSYRDQVIEIGRNSFGDKFIALTSFIEQHKYLELLSSINVGVFCNNRQQGLGTIYSLLIQGKKVFLKPDTSMWRELHDDEKLKVFNVNKIFSQKFEEFYEMDIKEKEENKNKILKRNSVENAKKIWDAIFGD